MPMRFTTNDAGHGDVQRASTLLVDKALRLIDAHLDGRDWMVGTQKSVADAFLYPMASWAYGFDKPTSDYPHIDRLIRKLANDPGVKAVHLAQGTQPKV